MTFKLISLILCAAVFVFGLSVYLVGSILSAPARSRIEMPGDLRAQPIRIRNELGADVAGSWIPGLPEKPTMLLLHGVRANRLQMLSRARLFARLGYSVLLFDFQAHGDSPGDRITFGYREKLDAQAAALLGERALPVDAIALESVYPDIATAIDNRIRRWLGPIATLLTPVFLAQLEARLHVRREELRPIDGLARLKIPVLIMSGESDLHTTAEDTRALYAKTREPNRLVFFPGAGHVDLHAFDRERYEKEVLSFFENSLDREPLASVQ